jgi:hypothetical protein
MHAKQFLLTSKAKDMKGLYPENVKMLMEK